jgi:nicotinamide phosphoribosyltransferase
MTADGTGNDIAVLDRLLDLYPTGILSVVADSYDIYAFIDAVIERKDRILARDGRFVLRPDSITPKHPTPEGLMVDILDRLWAGFGGEQLTTGHRLLDTHIRVLWGDGIDRKGIDKIYSNSAGTGFSAENIVVGMGGGLLQKVNRDTQRNAFKCSAQSVDGVWHDVQKKPLDPSKASKAGLLKLLNDEDGYHTVGVDAPGTDVLETVFLDGEVTRRQTFDEIRAIAEASAVAWRLRPNLPLG